MLTFLSAGVLLGLSAGFSPGPLMALVIAQSLRFGTREGVKASLAPLLTDAPIIALAVLLMAQVSRLQSLLGVVTLVGAGYILSLAVESWRAKPPLVNQGSGKPQSIRKASLVNLLNPSPYLFWLTVGAPSLVRAWAETPLSAAAYLLGFYFCLVGGKILIAVLVGRTRQFFSARVYGILMRLLSLLLVVFAILLAQEGIRLISAG